MRRGRFWAGLAVASALMLTGCGDDKEILSADGSSVTLSEESVAEQDKGKDAKPGAGETAKAMIPEWVLVEQEKQFADYTTGTFVAGFNVLDYDADPTGVEDNTQIFQQLLYRLGNLGGGTLYVPDGMYRFDGFLTVPKGVTLRGDWKEPEKDGAIEGTVLMAYGGKGKTAEDLPFITLVLGSGVMDVAIWYPEQDPMDIQPYSPAITMGQKGYFGNEYNNVKNVTLVNAYTGIQFSRENSGASPVINGVYGTPLAVGVEIDNIADVGRIEHIMLSPSYWVSSGLYERAGMEDPFEKSGCEEALRDYLYNNASGINMRRNDWSYTCYVDVEGYQYGYRAMKTASGADSMPNGHHYGMNFRNCQTAMEMQATANAGIMYAYVDIEDCENGIVFAPGASGPAQFMETRISAADQAIYIDILSAPKVQMSGSTIASGTVTVNAGVFDIVDCDFENGSPDTPHLTIGLSGRVNMVGNRYNGEKNVVNGSLFASNISDEDAQMEKLPEYVEVIPQVKLPVSMTLYLVTDYGADPEGETDCTEAVRQALADASGQGGIVFFPPGHYRFDDTLTVPTGVELRGACDNSTVPHGEGTTLEVYCGEGDINAEPFLQLQEGSGIRGLIINYPNQIYTGTKEEEPDYTPVPYPYTIQGQGKDIYIINVGLRASYLGVDFLTYRCDNHYVDFLTGQMFQVGMQIGGGSKDGILMNMHCNTIVYACGQQTKFGSYRNSPKDGISNKPIYDYAFYNLDNLILGDCENEFLYNDFNYGAHRGIVFTSEENGGAKNGLAIGFGIDKDCRGYYFEEGLSGADFDFINTQVVSTVADEETEYIYSDSDTDFHAVIYGGDFWGNPTHFVKMGENSGTLIVQTARMNHPGKSTFAVTEGGTFALKASISEKMSGTAEISNGAKVEFRANVFDNTGVNTEDYIMKDNLSGGAKMAEESAVVFLDRENWTADASHNPSNAYKALDGELNTRWDTSAAQTPGQWFLADLGEETEFNCIFLEFSGSSGDAPAKYEICVSNDGENWSDPIASGERGSGIIPVDPQNARYIKIAQNGTAGGYWSIHEFYLLNMD